MSEVAGVQGRGAVDLSSMVPGGQDGAGVVNEASAAGSPNGAQAASSRGAFAGSGAPTQPSVGAPLIVDITEASLEDAMALSQSVPVVLMLYSATSLTSKQALATLEDAARQARGAFQVGRVNVDTEPVLASAFQVQAIPAGVALVARRPVPLFEGAPTATQLQQVLAELLQVAPQLGVVGRLDVSEEDLERPMPPEHSGAREAEAVGDWDAAIAAWRKVLASNPGDQEAKTALVRAQFEQRQDQQADSSVLATADAMFARGQEAQAFDLLLGGIESGDVDEREALRARLVELFRIASDKAAVKTARARLATALMV